MWYPRSFASRLSLTVLAVFGLIQILLCALIVVVREGEIRRDFDERLALRASAALHIVEAASLRTGQITSAPLTTSPASAVAVTGLYWQLRRPDGTVIERCADLGEISLPVPPAEPGNAGNPILMTWRGDALTALAGRPKALRVVTIRGGIGGGPTFDIQAARDLEPVTKAIASLRRILLVAFVVGLALTGIAAWLLARRLERGLAFISRQAELITEKNPQLRIAPYGGESEFRRLAASLNTMLDGLEQAIRSREQFLADVSHELKAPLAALAAEARAITAATRASDACRQIENAVHSVVGSLTGTADALLMLAECSANDQGVRVAPVSVSQIVTEAIDRTRSHARQRGVRVVPMLPDDHEPHVAGHADLLRVTLQNLVRNAIDHSLDGTSVHIALSGLDHHERILVSDTGPGIPPELLPHVFDRFISGRPAVTDTGGHGLGLSIARRVVEAHGGTITIANRAAGGCEVEILLPRCTSQGGAIGPAA